MRDYHDPLSSMPSDLGACPRIGGGRCGPLAEPAHSPPILGRPEGAVRVVRDQRDVEVMRTGVSHRAPLSSPPLGDSSPPLGDTTVPDHVGPVQAVAFPQPTTDLPVGASPEEVAGLSRTARSLAAFGPVHISHGDLAGFPAVAAGATSVGTGSDSRQRVCAFTSYEARDPSAGGGGWFKRPTVQGLFGLLSRGQAERLSNQDAALATRLLPGALHPDGGKEAFLHHAACLSRIIELVSVGNFEGQFRALDELYATALADWPPAADAAGTASASAQWVTPLRNGLRRYARSEGWL